MPKVIYTAAVEKVTGKLAGSILKGVKSGSILRRGQSPRKPRSQKQQETRGLYNTYAGKWYTLSPTQKALWNKFASLLPGAMSGFNAYVQHNVRLLKAGHVDLTAITSPPPVPSTPEHIVGHELLRIAATTMRYQWTGPSDTSHWVEVFWAVAACYDSTGKEKWQHVDTTRSDDGHIEWTNDYPLETPIHVRARTIDLFGRVSPWTDTLIWEHGVPAPIGTGCVLYLPMDEGVGTKAMDYSGHGNHGNIIGASWVPGKYKYALSFDGLDDLIDCGKKPTLDITGNKITLEAWFYIREWKDNYYETIISKGWHYTLRGDYSLNQKIEYKILTNIGSKTLVSPTIPTNQWHFISATYDGSLPTANLKLYLDGQLEKTTSHTGNIQSNPSSLNIGHYAAHFLNGIIDQVRISTHPLSPNQVYDHFSRLQ